MLKDCIGGCFFPYKLVNWIMGQMSIPIDQMYTLSLNDNVESAWLLINEEGHWSTDTVCEKMTKNENFQFNTLHIYLTMNYEELLNNWQQN